MTPKTVIKLGIVTLVAVAAAAASVASRMDGPRIVRTSGSVLAGLEDRLDAVATISVLTADDEVTIERAGGQWTVKEKDEFPANRDDVRKVLFQLSQLRKVEAKTRKAELYSRIQVEDIEQEDAKSALVTLSDDKGEMIAGLIVGKSKFDMAGGSGRGLYLRKPDDDQAWLARGELELGRDANGWLAKDLLDIDGKQIRRITTTMPNGDVIVFSRQDPESGELALDGLGDGQKLKEDVLSGLDSALSGLGLTDVAAAEKGPMAGKETVETEIVTFGGLVINLSMTDGEDGIWAKIEASVGVPAEGAETGGKSTTELADEINARVSGWVFQVPDFKLRPLLKPRKDLLAA